MNGSVSTPASIFVTAGLTNKPIEAFYLAASPGASASMRLAEALPDDGTVIERGNTKIRGATTVAAIAIGGMLHPFPFLVSNTNTALPNAYTIVVLKLLSIAFTRYGFLKTPILKTIQQVIAGGAFVFAIGVWPGKLNVAS